MLQTKIINAQHQIWYHPDWLTQVTSDYFDANYWQQQQLIAGQAQGRGTTWFVYLAGRQAALRHYYRGGLLGKLVKDHYFFQGWAHTRSCAELHLLQHLQQQKVNVPTPIAAQAVRCGMSYQADILIERIAQARDLVTLLQQESLESALYRRIGQQIALLHQAQVNHTDLNIHNILLDAQEKVWLIDFDKCSLLEGNHWKEKNINRLLRSFKKEQHKNSICWDEQDWQQLLVGYQSTL